MVSLREIPDTPVALAEWVKTIRERLGWNQSQLAERAGLAPNQISRIESGDRADPRLSTITAIRAAFVNAARNKASPSLERFLSSSLAAELAVTDEERAQLAEAAWSGPEEPSQQAWLDCLRALRSMRGKPSQ